MSAKKAPSAPPAVDQYAARYATCRVLGHEWHHIGRAENADARTGSAGAFGWVSTCSECGMRRVRWFTRSGMIAASPDYTPPEGYARHGDDRLSMQEWRVTWARTLGITA